VLEDAVDDVFWEFGFGCYGGVSCGAFERDGGPEVEVVEDVEAGCVGHYLCSLLGIVSFSASFSFWSDWKKR